MKTLEEVRAHLLAGEFDYTAHAHRRAVERNISDRRLVRQEPALLSSRITRMTSMDLPA